MTKAILIGLFIDNGKNKYSDFERSLAEMKTLAMTLETETVCTVTQSLPAPDSATYIGSGKVSEIRALIEELNTDVVLFDGTLSPMQLKNLSNALDSDVADRTSLILDIFSEHARSREAKLQVETAELEYMLPRLAGLRTKLGRQGGTSGAMSNKGAGEKKIELDRRVIEHRMAELRRELDAVDRERATQRKKRMLSGIPRIALVGYTNAGKSTIMNTMLSLYGTDDDKKVLEKDMLFATLDTSVRKIIPDTGKPFLLSDTVGFIEGLPATLVKAFRSTLEEVKYADLILHVIDISDADYREHMKVTESTLAAIGAGQVECICVYNKCDRISQITGSCTAFSGTDIRITAKSPDDIRRLTEFIGEIFDKKKTECEMLIPYKEGNILSDLKVSSDYEIIGYTAGGTYIRAKCVKKDADRYSGYILNEEESQKIQDGQNNPN